MDKKVLELVLELVKTKSGTVTNTEIPFEVGEKYFIRTVTYHLTGRVKDIIGNFLILEDCAWIADSGRFNDAMEKGIDKQTNAEIEPYEHDVFVNIGSIIDGCEYPFSLPKAQK